MLQAPVPPKRLLCACAALCCFAAAIVLTPSGARSQLAAGAAARAEPTAPAAARLVPIAPARDAFAPRAGVADDTEPLPSARPAGMLPPAPALPKLGAPIVASHTRVTAIATGDHPIAIIERDGEARTVTVGDRLGTARITAIGDSSIVLDNGTNLTLAPAEPDR